MTAALKIVGGLVLLLVILFGLAATIVPRFLDRIYYRGPASDHFDGERFFDPGGDDDTFRLPAGRGGRAGFFWRYLTGSDGRPPWPARVAVTPSKPAARVEGERMVVTWIGHATVLVQTDGLNILTDPVWSERTGPFGRGPRRVAEPGVRFADLPRIDLVLLSHNHYDHLDLPTLKRLWARDRPAIVTGLGNDAILRGAGVEALGLDWTQIARLTPDGLQTHSCDPAGGLCLTDRAQVQIAPVHHWGSRWFTDRNRALWSGFIVRTGAGGTIFFAGDTGWGGGRWVEQARNYGPYRLAILPIGAFRFAPGQMASGSHMGPAEAVRAFDGLGAAAALPVHWGTFRLSYEGYDTPPKMLDVLMRCTGADPARFAAHAIGVPWEVPAAGAAGRVDVAKLDACSASPEVRALP